MAVKAWLMSFLLIFSSSVFAGKSYKWSINGNSYCEGWSAQESFDCYVEDHKKRADLKFKLSPPSVIKDGAVQSYFILASKNGGEWSQEPYYDSVVREEVVCPIETERDGVRKGRVKLFPKDINKKGMHLSPGLEYHYCDSGCLYEGNIHISHDLPPLGEGMMYFEQTGIPCIENTNPGSDKEPPYRTPPGEQPETDPKPPDNSGEWIMCPSHRGFYRSGTEPTGDCLKSPEKPKPPKSEEPKKPEEPKPEDPKKPEPEKPPEPDKPEKPGHHGGGGGGGGNNGGKDDGKDTPTPPLPGGGSGGHGVGSGGGSGGDAGGSGGGSGGGAGGGNNGGGNSGHDNDHGSPNGKDDGKGDGEDKGDGKGGVSGGNCQTGKAPTCKGDPVQCYIAREQWRTSCLAESGRTELGGKGDCKTGKKPVCRGDATTCYQLQLQFEQTCAAAGAEPDFDGAKQGFGGDVGEDEIKDAVGLGDAPSKDDIKSTFGKEVDVSGFANRLDDRGFIGGKACMAPQQYTVSGITFTIDWGYLCLFLQYVGYFVVAVGYFMGFRIVSGGFD